jgi:Putative prokaryotic signal transducing protein
MTHSDRSPPSGRLVRVFTATTIPEGLVARSLLEAEGIPVIVKGESEGPYRLGPVYLWVPEEYEVQAGIILANVSAAPGNPDTTEPASRTERGEPTGER